MLVQPICYRPPVPLAGEIRRVESHLAFIKQLDTEGWTAEVPDIDRQTLVEMSQLRQPRLEVRHVLAAMYMLLGIDESFLRVRSRPSANKAVC